MARSIGEVEKLLISFISGEIAPVHFVEQYQEIFKSIDEESENFSALEDFNDDLEYYVPEPAVRAEQVAYYGPQKLFDLADKLLKELGK